MDKLGIEPTLLLAQGINFLIIIVVLSKLLYKPILTMLEKRKKEIEEGIRLTEKMREEEEQMAIRKQKMLEHARKEGQEIIEESRKQAKEEEKDILAEAHRQAQQIMDKAKADIARLREEMEKDVRANAVTLGVAMAKKLLTGVISQQDKHKLIQKHLKELESVRVN